MNNITKLFTLFLSFIATLLISFILSNQNRDDNINSIFLLSSIILFVLFILNLSKFKRNNLPTTKFIDINKQNKSFYYKYKKLIFSVIITIVILVVILFYANIPAESDEFYIYFRMGGLLLLMAILKIIRIVSHHSKQENDYKSFSDQNDDPFSKYEK